MDGHPHQRHPENLVIGNVTSSSSSTSCPSPARHALTFTHTHAHTNTRMSETLPNRFEPSAITHVFHPDRHWAPRTGLCPFLLGSPTSPESSPWGQAYSICPVSVHPRCPLQDASLSPTQISSLLPSPATRGLSSSICGTLVLPGLNLAAPPSLPTNDMFLST